MLPILFGLSMFAMGIVGLFSLKAADIFSYFVILISIMLLISWGILLINKEWRIFFFSILLSVIALFIVSIIVSIPILLFD